MRTNRIVVLPGLVLALLLASSCGKGSQDKSDAAGTGETIVQTGYLEAVNSQSFSLPPIRGWNALTIVGLVEHGSVVNAGDSIIRFDESKIQTSLVEQETRLQEKEEALEKLKRSQANTRTSQEATMKSHLAEFELAKMSREAARFESERTQRIRELQFKQAEMKFAMQQRKTEFSNIIAEKDLRIQEISLERSRRDIEATREALTRLTIYTPISGVFEVMYNRRLGTLIKVGDEVYAGNRLAVVPDLTWMKVNTYVNEIDILKVHVGQKVAVRLDAMSNVTFDGEISYIGKLCHQLEGSNVKQKVFDVEVRLLQSDERLKPGMTVSCEFL